MKYLILLTLTIVIIGGVYYTSQKKTAENTGSSKITAEQAKMAVNNLPEVIEYLKNVPNGKIEVDNELEGEYNVHVYEIKNGHTATFNWYRISIKSGEIRPEFEVVQKTQEY